MLPDLGEPSQRMRIAILAPSPLEAPDSSLSHMFGVVLERRGDRESGFLVEEGELQTERLLDGLERAAASDVAVVLCGTAFALVHLLEAMECAEHRIALPEGSRVMETGGFKGSSRELPRDLLYQRLHRALGIPPDRIVNQYGMTELGSQFYDSVLRFPGTPRRKLGPPWARVRLIDPESGSEAPHGEIGMRDGSRPGQYGKRPRHPERRSRARAGRRLRGGGKGTRRRSPRLLDCGRRDVAGRTPQPAARDGDDRLS